MLQIKVNIIGIRYEITDIQLSIFRIEKNSSRLYATRIIWNRMCWVSRFEHVLIYIKVEIIELTNISLLVICSKQ